MLQKYITDIGWSLVNILLIFRKAQINNISIVHGSFTQVFF